MSILYILNQSRKIQQKFAFIILTIFILSCSNEKSQNYKSVCCIKIEYIGLSGSLRESLIISSSCGASACRRRPGVSEDQQLVKVADVETEDLDEIIEIVLNSEGSTKIPFLESISGYAVIFYSDEYREELLLFTDYNSFIKFYDNLVSHFDILQRAELVEMKQRIRVEDFYVK
jgi:hypothetical protein